MVEQTSFPSEASYTRPRPDCPHPERWHAVDEQASEVEVIRLVQTLVHALQPDAVIETGTYTGHMAYAIGQALVLNGQGKLVTMEPDPARHAESVERTNGLPVECLRRGSLTVSCDEITMLAPGHVGFAWFDSLIDLRLREFEHFADLFDDRTIVGFHDTGPHFGNWSQAIREHPRLTAIHLPTPRGVLLAQFRPA